MKIKSLKWVNNISITFLVATNCNFWCYYCNDSNREWNHITSIEEINKFINFIFKLDFKYNNYNIFISISWWEPLINKNSFYIIEKLLLHKYNNNTSINLITNGFLLLKYQKYIKKFSQYKNFIISISYHYKEYFKFDKNKLIFFNTISMLEKNNFINYNIKFLVPTEKNEFYDMKNIINNLLKKWINKKNILLDTIKFLWWKKLDKYDCEILEYYNSFKNKKLNKNEISKKTFLYNEITFFDWKKWYFSWEEILDKELNNFYKYNCYPFNSSFLKIFPNLDTYILRCKSYDKKYSFKQVLEILWWENKDKYVICLSDRCNVLPAMWLKKEYNEKNYKYDIILNKLSKYFLIDWYKLIWLKHYNNWININTIAIEYFDEDNDILTFFIELLKDDSSWIFNNGKIYVHCYIKEKFWEILRNKKLKFEIISKITIIIKKFEDIFLKILINWNNE